ncbi:nucleotidyltransferase family protein [uncultured Ferrovibrio sp.]|jgi:hypothetical protein|uniref:nucleotidyltransferase domain-containing protein n=1 Tax=uncultured Ferrovibrio sp. TaxID=1576913 RepID=UPI00261D0942|nr:nucleotidyltransferase family protein [uncultured Ferrovibrio sp.]
MIAIHSRQALHILTEALRPMAGGEAGVAHRREVDDWPPILALANAHFISAALYPSLAAAQDWNSLPEDLRDYLALLHEQNGLRNSHLRQQAEEVIAAFNAAGVAPLLLKGGAALFLDYYDDPAARMIRDLDFLVPRSQADTALNALSRIGYRAVARYPEGHNAYGDFARDGAPAAIDLHLEVVDAPYLLPAASLWQQARQLCLPCGVAFAPSIQHAVLHNILHAQVHHTGNYYRGSFELRQLLDFVTLARRYRDQIDWTELSGHMRSHRLTGVLHAYLLAADRLLGLPWPLPERPGMLTRWQLQRCLLQIRMPMLEMATLPLANLWSAFAAHRMDGLYGTNPPLFQRRIQHAAQFLRKSTGDAMVARLFKSH